MWEFTSEILLFDNKAYNFQLSLSIYKNEHPEIIENTSQYYIDLMKRCWNEDLGQMHLKLRRLLIISVIIL